MVSITPRQSQSQASTANITGLKRRWLSINEAAAYIGCCRSLLDKDRSSRVHGIPFSKFGRVVRYDLEDLDAFLQSRKVVA
ncbi:helix-turn-helix domain-containing protein [Deltaproteobacteria bacterium OttesenSCG-928-M10]|nr:helix-turn-helix domain-containing protein [Deltaproteobacteria bacterium OttesenSCG-928-M10]